MYKRSILYITPEIYNSPNSAIASNSNIYKEFDNAFDYFLNYLDSFCQITYIEAISCYLIVMENITGHPKEAKLLALQEGLKKLKDLLDDKGCNDIYDNFISIRSSIGFENFLSLKELKLSENNEMLYVKIFKFLNDQYQSRNAKSGDIITILNLKDNILEFKNRLYQQELYGFIYKQYDRVRAARFNSHKAEFNYYDFDTMLIQYHSSSNRGCKFSDMDIISCLLIAIESKELRPLITEFNRIRHTKAHCST